MPTQSALTLTDTIAQETQRITTPVPPGAVGAQAAFVRALVDEVERHHPEDRRVVPLREQLGDELLRLARLFEGAPSRGEAAGAEEPLDVLVVDDDDDALRAAETVLRHLGYRCRTAYDAEAALREFDREPAAIVLSDWSMPGMSGPELCASLKRRERRPYVILATAFDDNARLLDGVGGGADDFLRKPLDVEELEARLLSASRLVRAVAAVAALRERLSSVAQNPAGD
jgi:CheY-like chemotaxis protein